MIKKLGALFNKFIRLGFNWLLLLLILFFSSPNRPVTFEKVISAEYIEHDQNLQALADSFLPLFDNMSPVVIDLKDEPILINGTNTEKGVAYAVCDNHEIPTIFIKKSFYRKTNQIQLANILKHELTHAWLCRQHLTAGHDERFRRKFSEVGGFGN